MDHSGDPVVPGTDDSELLDPRDELMIALLAVGYTHSRVAQECGVSTKTIQRRLQDSEFERLVSARRRERVAATTGRLVALTEDAIGVLQTSFSSEDERLRLQAARLLLEFSHRYHREVVIQWELSARMDQLETELSDRRLSRTSLEAS